MMESFVLNDAEALYNSGLVATDNAERVRMFKLSAAQGNALAQYFLGQVYGENTRETAEEYANEFKLAKIAAEQGEAHAKYELGLVNYYGDDAAKDYLEALKWLKLAADLRIPSAQYSLGLMYANGQGVKQDFSEAIKWFNLAIEQSDIDAIDNRDLNNIYDELMVATAANYERLLSQG